jgi:hypothetical protein
MSINQKILFSIIAFVFLELILVFFLIYPSFSAIRKSSFDLLKEKERIALFDKEVELQKKAEALFLKYQQDFEEIEKIFVDPDVPLELINFLENTALATGTQFNLSSLTKKEQNKDPWPSLILGLSATSTPSNFLRFLEKVESAPYPIEVSDLILKNDFESMTIKVFTK